MSDSETEFVEEVEIVNSRAHRTPQQVKMALEKARAVKAAKSKTTKAVRELQATTTRANALATKSRTQALKAEAIAIRNGFTEAVEEVPVVEVVPPAVEEKSSVTDMIAQLQKQIEKLSTPAPAPVPEKPKPKRKRATKPKAAPVDHIEHVAAPVPTQMLSPAQMARQDRMREQQERMDELRRCLGRF